MRGWLENESLDVVVIHQQMPRVTGLELNKSLKNQNNTQAIPVIFYSDQLTVDLKTRALQKEATTVLEKPFPLQAFLNLVAQACEKTLK